MLIEQAGLAVRAVKTAGSKGAYVHDRRQGERVSVAETSPDPLSRHEVARAIGRYWLRLVELNQPRLRSGNPNIVHAGEAILLPTWEGS